MALVIVTVTLNAALDVTYGVPAVNPGQSHRVNVLHNRAGGKGVNVARVLAALGHEVLATGLTGGEVGSCIRDDLRRDGVPEAMFEISGESRRTLTVVSNADSAATAFNERGPVIGFAEWAAFCDHLRRLIRPARVVVLSGSLPAGLDVDSYAELVRLARRGGALLSIVRRLSRQRIRLACRSYSRSARTALRTTDRCGRSLPQRSRARLPRFPYTWITPSRSTSSTRLWSWG